jgi:hypothetical protein
MSAVNRYPPAKTLSPRGRWTRYCAEQKHRRDQVIGQQHRLLEGDESRKWGQPNAREWRADD